MLIFLGSANLSQLRGDVLDARLGAIQLAAKGPSCASHLIRSQGHFDALFALLREDDGCINVSNISLAILIERNIAAASRRFTRATDRSLVSLVELVTHLTKDSEAANGGEEDDENSTVVTHAVVLVSHAEGGVQGNGSTVSDYEANVIREGHAGNVGRARGSGRVAGGVIDGTGSREARCNGCKIVQTFREETFAHEFSRKFCRAVYFLSNSIIETVSHKESAPIPKGFRRNSEVHGVANARRGAVVMRTVMNNGGVVSDSLGNSEFRRGFSCFKG
mmetsp:Transcript_30484/g.55627  ORF Transcript_30484/g.55627 Transcript_30484/m.55627 type:complete len:277 (-) Transcript_30484:320-1150(-)